MMRTATSTSSQEKIARGRSASAASAGQQKSMTAPILRMNSFAAILSLFISWALTFPVRPVASAFDGRRSTTSCSSGPDDRGSIDNGATMQTAATGAATRQWGTVEKLSSSVSNVSFDIYRVFMKDDGTYPNNSQYPALLYKSAFHGTQAEGVRAIVSSGQWTSPWVWGIFTYHHYHSKAWELLLCTRGEASVQLGGSTGPTVTIRKGDLALVPPGLAHKQLDDAGGFTLLGAYPTECFDGSIDTLTGPPTDAEKESIVKCYVPVKDPIFGLNVAGLCCT